MSNTPDENYQTTLQNIVTFSGIALHNGHTSNLRILPAEANSGINFIRTDLSKHLNLIKANFKNVSDTKLCTRLTNDFNVSVSTVEHLMAAFMGYGIDNAMVEINCPETPILDGSSLSYINSFKKAGVKILPEKRKIINILKKVNINQNDKFISIEPFHSFEINMEIDHDSKAIKNQKYRFTLEGNSFENQIASARTYGFKEHAEVLRNQGYALGASINNALVFHGDKIISKEGLRYSDEPVRHKVLDCMGDIFMSGHRIRGKIFAYKTGHELNNKLMHAIFSNPQNWEKTEVSNFTENLIDNVPIAALA